MRNRQIRIIHLLISIFSAEFISGLAFVLFVPTLLSCGRSTTIHGKENESSGFQEVDNPEPNRKHEDNQKSTEEIIFKAIFTMASNLIENENLMNDPYFTMETSDSIIIPEDVVEISVKVSGLQHEFLVNGMSIEEVAQSHQGFKVSEFTRSDNIKGRDVRVTIKRLILNL